ncbi:MAG TPA: copper transporter [Acidimicrobiales bacterium]|nr:copper transporter [Acidimicrobiales bacterium]
MISFRFHIVSLAAVFMGLALGIVLGTAFINDATINRLETSIKRYRAERDDAQHNVGVWSKFADDAEASLVAGRLDGERVFTIVPEGLSGSLTDKMHALLTTAGAVDAGRLTLANAWADDPAPTDDIAKALDIVGPSNIDSVTDAAAERLAREFAAGGGPTLPALVDANLARLDAGDAASAPGLQARFLVIDDGAPAGLLEPLTRALAAQIPKSVLVADASPDDTISQSMVVAMRNKPESALFSTVDHLDTVPGRLAAILALRDFDRGATGDYGSGPGHDRAAPAPG